MKWLLAFALLLITAILAWWLLPRSAPPIDYSARATPNAEALAELGIPSPAVTQTFEIQLPAIGPYRPTDNGLPPDNWVYPEFELDYEVPCGSVIRITGQLLVDEDCIAPGLVRATTTPASRGTFDRANSVDTESGITYYEGDPRNPGPVANYRLGTRAPRYPGDYSIFILEPITNTVLGVGTYRVTSDK